MSPVLHGDGWGMCGQREGGTGSYLELLPAGLLLALLVGCACTQMLVPELSLALGSVGRGTWHAHTLIPLGSPQNVPLPFKEGIGTAQNFPYLLFSPLQGEKGDRGERVSGCAFP